MAATKVPIPVTKVITSCGVTVLPDVVLVPVPGDGGTVDGAGVRYAVSLMSLKRIGLNDCRSVLPG